MTSTRPFNRLALAIAGVSIIGLTGCGNSSDLASTSRAVSTDCPPAQKGDGVLVGSRYNYEDLLAANQWRTDMFPRDCAGALGALVPDLPAGYGVRPNYKPYVMKTDQVYVAYAALPEPLYLEDGNPNIPPDLDSIDYEIVQFKAEEIATLRDWMTQNPDNYTTGEISGDPVYFLGGFGSGRPGKGDRLSTSLHAFLADNVVVRVSHKGLFSQRGELEPPPLVVAVMGDIINRSKQESQ